MMSTTSAAVAMAILPLSIIPDGGLTGSVMGITTDFMGFIRGLSITTIVALIFWMLWKFEIVALISVQEGTVAVRTSWGRPRFYRTGRDGRKGRLFVLHPGRHLLVKGLHGLVVVNLRVDVIEMPKKEITFRGRTLIREGMLLDWRTRYEDSFEGDLRLLNRIWYLSDHDVRDGSNPNYHQTLVGAVEQALNDALPNIPAKKDGFPDFRLATIEELLTQSQQLARMWITGDGRQLLEENKKEFIFPEFIKMTTPSMAWTEAQIEADAEIKAAKIKAKASIKNAVIEADAKIKSARILAGQPEIELENDTDKPEAEPETREEAASETQSAPRLHIAGAADLVDAL